MIFRRKQGDPKAGRYLLAYFVSYLYMIGITYLFVYGNPATIIHTFRTGLFAALLMPVCAYFYVHQSLYPHRLRWRHLWHLLPIGVFVVNFAPFFLLSASEKWEIFNAMDATEYRIGFSQGWFMPQYGHVIIRMIIMIAYWTGQAHLLIRARRENFHPIRIQYPYTWRWLHIFLATQALMFGIPIIGVFLSSNQTETVIYSITAAGTIALQCFYLLLHPEILYTETFGKERSNGLLATPSSVSDATLHEENNSRKEVKVPSPEPKSKMPEIDFSRIEARANEVMENKKCYLKQGYTLHEFASDTGLSAQRLSAFINTRYGINFNDYLNKYRIAHVVEKLKAGENAQKTLEAIAQEGGFQSRGTFIRAFKKEHGMTPSEFLERMEA
jgi:AraC-like DNA-binding protein